MTLAPTRFSLPAAAALPVTSMTKFTKTARRRLVSQGLVTALQLAELASRNPAQLRRQSGITGTKARRILEAELGPLPDFANVAVAFQPTPAAGVPLAGMPTQQTMGPSQAHWLIQQLEKRGELPKSASLTKHMQAVRNQGNWPTCVGHAVTAIREFAIGMMLSPAFAYLGSKELDGTRAAGTWISTALQWQHQVGHLREAAMPYAEVTHNPDLSGYRDTAFPLRSPGHSWLIPHKALRSHVPAVFRALLTGQMFDCLGPVPIAFSIGLKESFVSTATALDGLVPMPLPSEKTCGGHAMVAVGYIDADDPKNPFGLDYIIVRNSWGETWAGQNPLAPPGHALIPAAYFTTDLLYEAFITLDHANMRGSF